MPRAVDIRLNAVMLGAMMLDYGITLGLMADSLEHRQHPLDHLNGMAMALRAGTLQL